VAGDDNLAAWHLEILDLVRLYQKFTEVPMISISNTQRQPLH
jgi:glycosyltransferase involved in cell wall biosynthesis